MNENTANNTNTLVNETSGASQPPSKGMPNMSKNKFLFVLVAVFAVLLVALSIMSLTNMKDKDLMTGVEEVEEVVDSSIVSRNDFVGMYMSRTGVMAEPYVGASIEVELLSIPRKLELREDSTAVLSTTYGDGTETTEYGNWTFDEETKSVKMELTMMGDEPMDKSKILFMNLDPTKMAIENVSFSDVDFQDDVMIFDRQ